MGALILPCAKNNAGALSLRAKHQALFAVVLLLWAPALWLPIKHSFLKRTDARIQFERPHNDVWAPYSCLVQSTKIPFQRYSVMGAHQCLQHDILASLLLLNLGAHILMCGRPYPLASCTCTVLYFHKLNFL